MVRNLRANEIECRVSSITEKGITLLLFKNARVDMAILDEAFGICGWKRTHCKIGDETYCTISIRDDESGEWIEKMDVGTEAFAEKAKSVASDSFKRAAFNVGVGRELYTAPFIYIPINRVSVKEYNGKTVVKDKFSVRSITTSEDKIITSLEVANQNGELVFSYENAGAVNLTEDEKAAFYKELTRTGITEKNVFDRYNISSIKEMDSAIYTKAMAGLKKTKSVKE